LPTRPNWQRGRARLSSNLLGDSASSDSKIGPVVRRPDLLTWESEQERLLYDPASGRAHWLNATAAVIWELADGVVSAGQLAEMVGETFGVGSDEARAGVEAVVNDLSAQGLLGDAREPPILGSQIPYDLSTSEVPFGPRFLGVPPNQ